MMPINEYAFKFLDSSLHSKLLLFHAKKSDDIDLFCVEVSFRDVHLFLQAVGINRHQFWLSYSNR